MLRLIGENLARARLSLNRSQQDVADDAGIGLRTLQRLEKTKQNGVSPIFHVF